MRYEFNRSQKREMWKRCKDSAGVPRCENVRLVTADGLHFSSRTARLERCNAPVTKGRCTFDHTDPTYIAARRVTAADGQVLCKPCDKQKYSTVDRPKIDKVRRLADKEIGARRPRRSLIPGSKGSGIRRRFNRSKGTWETIRVHE